MAAPNHRRPGPVLAFLLLAAALAAAADDPGEHLPSRPHVRQRHLWGCHSPEPAHAL